MMHPYQREIDRITSELCDGDMHTLDGAIPLRRSFAVGPDGTLLLPRAWHGGPRAWHGGVAQ